MSQTIKAIFPKDLEGILELRQELPEAGRPWTPEEEAQVREFVELCGELGSLGFAREDQ